MRPALRATCPQIARDPQTGESKGYGFVSYTDFEASDAALESMNGQFLMNKPIQVQYAFKKDGKGERHGTDAERTLAAQARKNNALPAASRPPAAPPGMSFGPVPGMPYQPGQFAGALAQQPPLPPGFGGPQPGMPGMAPGMGMPGMGMPMMGMPPMGAPPMGMQPMGMPGMMPGAPGMPGMPMQMGMPPPPAGMPVYNPAAGYPPPPPGFGQPGMPGMVPPGPPQGVPMYR
jgi:splicing factor 3B subunit 4